VYPNISKLGSSKFWHLNQFFKKLQLQKKPKSNKNIVIQIIPGINVQLYNKKMSKKIQ
jgi:hypothetical protein